MPALLAFASLMLASTGAGAHRVAAAEPGAAAVQAAEADTSMAVRVAESAAKDARTALAAGDAARARAIVARAFDELASAPGTRDTREIGAAWSALGIAADDAGDLPLAERAWKRALDAFERALPADHPDVLNAREEVAILAAQMGDMPRARVLLEAVLEGALRVGPEDGIAVQRARTNLANVAVELGDYRRALELQTLALAALERGTSADDPRLLIARANLANTQRLLGDVAGSLATQRAVLAARERTLPADHLDLAVSRTNVADLLRELGDLEGARDLQELVLASYERTLDEGHPEFVRARANLAFTLEYAGDLYGARAVGERALDAARRALPEDHPERLRATNNLAVTTLLLGDRQAARELFEEVLEVRSRVLPEDHPDLLLSRANLALILKYSGDLAATRDIQRAIVDAYARTHPETGLALVRAKQNLASTLRDLGEVAAAREIEEPMLAALERVLPPTHPELQSVRNNFAVTLELSGELERARELEERLLHDALLTHPEDHPHVRQARKHLLWNRVAFAECAGAVELARDLAAVLVREVAESAGKLSPRELEEHVDGGRDAASAVVALALGAPPCARDDALVREAFAVTESRRCIGVVAAALSRSAASDPALAGLAAQERRCAEELARAAHSAASGEAISEARRELDRVRRERAARIAALPRSDAWLGVPSAERVAARLGPDQVLVAYTRYLKTTFDEANAGVHLNERRLAAFVVQPPLSADAAATVQCFDLGDIDSITRIAGAWRDALGAGGADGDDGERDGRGVSAGASARADVAPSSAAIELAARVLAPLLPAIGDARRIVLAVDDVLHAVPFDALPLESGLVGDRFAIEQHLTLRDVFVARGELGSARDLVALGGARYDAAPARYGEESDADEADETGDADAADLAVAAAAPTGESRGPEGTSARPSILRGTAWADGFWPLAHTAEEAHGVARSFEQAHSGARAVVLEGRWASSESLRTLASGARYLHLATHGWFAPESIGERDAPAIRAGELEVARRMSNSERVASCSPMLLCGLALAGASLAADRSERVDGLVTAEEVATWDLARCELAVLSACDTNVGIRLAGRGVESLQKALHMAGARSVITSLWKVPDEATKELMLDFYRRLWVEKKSKHQALWEAKKKLREAKDERGEPKYTTRDWAAWVLTGAPD